MSSVNARQSISLQHCPQEEPKSGSHLLLRIAREVQKTLAREDDGVVGQRRFCHDEVLLHLRGTCGAHETSGGKVGATAAAAAAVSNLGEIAWDGGKSHHKRGGRIIPLVKAFLPRLNSLRKCCSAKCHPSRMCSSHIYIGVHECDDDMSLAAYSGALCRYLRAGLIDEKRGAIII